MDGVPHAIFDVAALQDCLRDRLASTDPLTVTAVLRAFLEVSALPCDRRLWSLEFGFDEDDSRIARFCAMFSERQVTAPQADDLIGFEVHVLLPRLLPNRAAEALGTALEGTAGAPTVESLVARFLVALAELGAYRTIELLTARSATIYPA